MSSNKSTTEVSEAEYAVGCLAPFLFGFLFWLVGLGACLAFTAIFIKAAGWSLWPSVLLAALCSQLVVWTGKWIIIFVAVSRNN